MSKKKKVPHYTDNLFYVDGKHIVFDFDVDNKIIDCACPECIRDELNRNQFCNLINMLKVACDNLEYVLDLEVRYEFEEKSKTF